jgi:hypothetical protein
VWGHGIQVLPLGNWVKAIPLTRLVEERVLYGRWTPTPTLPRVAGEGEWHSGGCPPPTRGGEGCCLANMRL